MFLCLVVHIYSLSLLVSVVIQTHNVLVGWPFRNDTMVAVDPATRKRVLRVIIVSLLLDLVSRNSEKEASSRVAAIPAK